MTGRQFRAVAVLVALAACSDKVVGPRVDGRVPEIPVESVTAYTCTASVQEGTLSCTSGAPSTAAAPQNGLKLDRVYGGQNIYVRLSSANTSYNASTGIFQTDVTITNLLRDAIGTNDLVNPAPEGVRVFFTRQPTVTSGTGAVTIANADNVGTFTAGAQPYFQYNEVLSGNETSPAKNWQFAVPNSVGTFVFSVAVSTPVAPRLVITEIMANPAASTDASGEYFEVHNAGVEPVDMTGWTFVSRSGSSGLDAIPTVPSGTVIPVGRCAIFGNFGDPSANGGITHSWSYGSMSFENNNTDYLVVRTPGGVTMDSVSFDGFSVTGPPEGASRRLTDVNSDNSSLADAAWTTSTTAISSSNTDKGSPCAFASSTSEYPGIGGLDNATATASSMVRFSGDNQSAYAERAVSVPPTVKVLDAFGNPKAGVVVTFTSAGPHATLSKGAVAKAIDTTGTDGLASPDTWTFGIYMGSYTLTASSPGIPSVAFAGIAKNPRELVLVTPPSSQVPSGIPMPQQPVVQLNYMGVPASAQGLRVDAALVYGQIPGVVNLDGFAVNTNASGRGVYTALTVREAPRRIVLEFRVANYEPVRSDTLEMGYAPVRLELVNGDRQTAAVGTTLPINPQVRAIDPNGQPIAGVTVTFTPSLNAGTVTGGTQVTGADGIATVGSWTLGSFISSHLLTVRASNAPGVSFVATAVAGPAAVLTKMKGDNQSVLGGEVVPDTIRVRVTDSFGNALRNATVTFTVNSGGGSIASSTALTNTSGDAVAPAWTLGSTPGTNSLTASINGLSATFTATGLPAFAATSMGTNCVLDASGFAWCWGSSSLVAASPDSGLPVQVPGSNQFTSIVTGVGHACALTSAGAAYCWGSDNYGQLGDGTASATNRTPTAVIGPVGGTGPLVFTSLAAGGFTTCGLTATGAAYCWGYNGRGTVGDGTETHRAAPTPVSGGLTFRFLSVGEFHACGLTTSDEAYCWGWNSAGQAGAPMSGYQCSGGAGLCIRTPVRAASSLTFRTIGASSASTCATTTTNETWCWGSGPSGLYYGPTPWLHASGFSFTSIVSRGEHYCAIDAAGAAHCWGANSYGQLGAGDFANTPGSWPVRAVGGGKTFTQIAATSLRSCGVGTDGIAYCWGYRPAGDGSWRDHSLPVAVARR